jgi:hypothetical protein
MFGPRVLAAALGVLVLASGAQAQTAQVAAPRALHGFLLRADEPLTTSFARTPAFAWSPVPGALRYQFQLATSPSFRENAIVYSANSLASPVVAPQVTLPWIDDMLHARVRAILRNTTTPWSTRFAFDMNPPPAPKPWTSYDGMLRWTPVEGADAYQIWLVDIPRIKIVTSYTNVLDEREFYTFHPSLAWIQTVHWRIRALRRNIGATQNGLPAVSYGPWSPVYASTNSGVRGGQINLVGTLSDTFASANGNGGPDHRLMPGFLWTGDQTDDGRSAELFRVYVFTDSGCLNRVFTGAVVGGPAYAPRPLGPLQLPRDLAGIAAARSAYIFDGAESQGYSLDGLPVVANESLPPTTPTTTVPTDSDSNAGVAPPPTAAPPTTASVSSTGGPTGTAPVDIWDTESLGGYWWTVVPVEAVEPGRATSNVTGVGAEEFDKTIPVANAINFNPGDVLTIGSGATAESVTVKGINGSSLNLDTGLKNDHGAGELVVRTGGELRYRDLELPQDVCDGYGGRFPRRVARFTKNSEPALTSAGEAFASGLSSSGKLVSASRNSPFYGNPLVAWTPALGADVYQVQWSRTRAPFKPELTSAGPGVMAWGTSAVLPLTPRTWYYRVRGFDFSLPTNAQQMSWSDPSRIVVAKPKFRVVGGGK